MEFPLEFEQISGSWFTYGTKTRNKTTRNDVAITLDISLELIKLV